MPTYHRLDLGMKLKKNKKRGVSTCHLVYTMHITKRPHTYFFISTMKDNLPYSNLVCFR